MEFLSPALYNSFLARGCFCCLLITFAYSLDPDEGLHLRECKNGALNRTNLDGIHMIGAGVSSKLPVSDCIDIGYRGATIGELGTGCVLSVP